MADFVAGSTIPSSGLSNATVQWTAATGTTTPIVAEESEEIVPGDPAASDLLQQAMNEVAFSSAGGVSYMDHSGEVLYVQEDGKLVSLDSMIASGDMAVMSVPQTAGVVCGDQQGSVTMDIGRVLYKGENTDTVCMLMPSDPGIVNVTSSATLTYSNTVGSTYSANDVRTSQAACPIEINSVQSLSNNQTAAKGQTNAGDVPSSATKTDSAPLGSSQNPIRIIQRGNQYTAMQHLTPDQLKQIVHIVQEQQKMVQAKNPSSSGSATLYNPDAGAQVQDVYRITSSSGSTVGGDSNNKTIVRMVTNVEHGHQKRLVRKRKKDEEDWMVGTVSDLSRQEKEERKKHRPRTRSGRVSKPPQYMVKDYKHIHPVDYDEDYDDSDGGYSDFKHSGDEVDGEGQDDSLSDVGHSGKVYEYDMALTTVLHLVVVECAISLLLTYIRDL